MGKPAVQQHDGASEAWHEQLRRGGLELAILLTLARGPGTASTSSGTSTPSPIWSSPKARSTRSSPVSIAMAS